MPSVGVSGDLSLGAVEMEMADSRCERGNSGPSGGKKKDISGREESDGGRSGDDGPLGKM